MSPKLFSLNSLAEKRKPQPQESKDELALVKAAAWAWYQHGSGSEGKTMNEFDFTRTQRAARPSRYKLEAMRMAKEANKGTNKLSLLDNYEIQSISRHLDRLIESSHNKVISSNNSSNNGGKDNGNRRMNKKRIIKGFWPRNGVVCGGGNDVADGSALRGGWLSVKRIPQVDLAKCLASSKVEWTNSAL